MSDWQPELYMQFKSERTQPSIDLVSKINLATPRNIIDIGCGPGNSTQILTRRWPDADIVGIDSSASMIHQARKDYPNQKWCIADASTYESTAKFDLVFSNAVIQWIPDHKTLLAHFHALLTDTGVLAVQVPQFWDMPLGMIIKATAEGARWKEKTNGVSAIFTMEDHYGYYDILSDLFGTVEMWETHYLHVLKSHESILEMIRSTGLKPYLETLADGSDKNDFEQAVLRGIRDAYPAQKNGKVILPFKRLFLVGINT